MNYSKIHTYVEMNRQKLLSVATGEGFIPSFAFKIAIEDHFLGLPLDDKYSYDENLEEYFKENVLTCGNGKNKNYSPIMTEVLKKLYEVHHKEYYKHIKQYVYKVCDYIYKNGGGFENSGLDTFDEWCMYLADDMDNNTNHLEWNWECNEPPKPLVVDLKLYDSWCDFEKKKIEKTVSK